jgi:hypothetical protein
LIKRWWRENPSSPALLLRRARTPFLLSLLKCLPRFWDRRRRILSVRTIAQPESFGFSACWLLQGFSEDEVALNRNFFQISSDFLMLILHYAASRNVAGSIPDEIIVSFFKFT